MTQISVSKTSDSKLELAPISRHALKALSQSDVFESLLKKQFMMTGENNNLIFRRVHPVE